ncbi:UPF0183 protein CG7083 [Eurytemora carolleeae]|uniref:UPF0183 protein CG7083 n=1 Tax=Eurytemora carolleeae TaxID=1294199 RepID=UPI000C782742|nr:UPF0183 protein CG7083 [Eurytemora carolleeae]|eukprot:XP_023346757.1 UPF0183 protein CG7083-like [Eurytemora affinis]
MLELEVIPEHGLTSENIEFILGTHFSSAIAYIQNQVGTIKGVEISYCDKDPLSFDLTIKLTRDGIKLVFDSLTQTLKIIEIYDLSLVRLKYCDLLFNCPDVSPTIEQVDQSFGATRPGVYDAEKQIFTLTFRGLSFQFPAETGFQPSYAGSRRELGKLQFSPGESPSVSHLAIYSGNSLADCTPPPPPPQPIPTLLCKSVDVIRFGRRSCGLSFTLEPSGEIRSNFNQRFVGSFRFFVFFFLNSLMGTLSLFQHYFIIPCLKFNNSIHPPACIITTSYLPIPPSTNGHRFRPFFKSKVFRLFPGSAENLFCNPISKFHFILTKDTKQNNF